MFENYGEVPEEVAEENEGEKESSSKVENARKGLPEDEDRLFRFIVDKLEEDDYDQYEHLPDHKEDHLTALMRHARAEDSTFGTDEHHSNGIDVILVRQFFGFKRSANQCISERPREPELHGFWAFLLSLCEKKTMGGGNQHERGKAEGGVSIRAA
ncbi:hypothetical protein AKJ49_00495 [candidate division MSBL1 archaeon SCGC-AAA382A03]|uniref:Uncharacterized protein n=1 Tax=candidate division MSBL1 archaeon SCGC-AAA382A03 TaxID=1698278 RepID=A0A133VGL1_9EURY|nr:hypothetical protein AKJ49_00495 [candidate division MSBL1 archaeon SCGC-AAA382A03]